MFTSISAVFVVPALLKRRSHAWLAVYGAHAQARVQQAYPDTSTSVNGTYPWRISAQWRDPKTNQLYVFRSERIWFDPRPYLQGETVDVRINADNPRQYEVDLSFLPTSG